MVFAQLILTKKGGALGTLWQAAHQDRRVNKQVILTTDITISSRSITHALSSKEDGLTLRHSGSLLLGVVRIFSYKVKFLSMDCDQALTKMKMSFRPGLEKVSEGDGDDSGGDEDEEQAGGSEGESRERAGSARKKRRTEGDHLPLAQLSLDILPPMGDDWRHAAAQTIARKQDITLEETDNMALDHDPRGLSLTGAGGEDEDWQAFDPGAFNDDDHEIEGGGDEPEVGRFSPTTETNAEMERGGVEEEKQYEVFKVGQQAGDSEGGDDDDYAPVSMDDDDEEFHDENQDQPPLPQDHTLPFPETIEDERSGFLSPTVSLNMSKDSVSLTAKKERRKSKKRPLNRDKSTQITSADMKAQLADTTDIVSKRSRPREYLHIRRPNLLPPEARMDRPLIEGLSPSLSEFVKKLMVTPKALDLDIRPTPKYALEKARVAEADGSTTEDEEVPPKEEEEDDFDDNDDGIQYNDHDEEGVGFDVVLAEDEESRQHGDKTDGDEDEDDEDDDGFVRQNDAHETGAFSSTQWHPNTVKMCELLRKKMEVGGRDHVSFHKLIKGSRRSKAANKFFEILQLKTWDFIQVRQAKPFSEIKVTPAARFHEPIPI